MIIHKHGFVMYYIYSYVPAAVESVWQTCDGSGLQFPSFVHIAKIRKLTRSREASQLNINDDPSSVEL